MTSTAEAATGPKAYFRIQVEAGLRVVAAEGCVRELLGYEAGDFVSPRVLLLDRVHRDDVELAGRLLRGEADTGIHPCNLRVRHADGRMRCLRGEWVRGREAENGKVVELALWGAADAGGSEDPSHGPSIFAAVMESVAEGVFFADTAHVFRHANENFRRYFPDAGGRPRAVTGLTVYDLLPEAEADRQYEIQKAILAGAPAREEVREAPDAAGNARWFYLRNFAVRDEHGEVIGLFGVVRNVTENVLTERELRENRELLKLFIEHAPAALAMLDRNLRYLAVSRRWQEIHGLEGKELVGQLHYEVLPEVPEQWRESHQRVLAGETIHAGEGRLHLQDGADLRLSRELMPWKAADGTVGGIIIFVEDITKQKRAEERLELASRVFTHAAEGIMITDAEGAIVEVNDAFTRITGYTREEALGKNPRILNSGRQSREFYAEMWRDLVRTGQWFGEIWNRRKDGQVYPELLTISAVVDAKGETHQYVGLFSDLTAIKQHEQKLAEAARFDLLTGLPNRSLLAERLQKAMSQAERGDRRVAILCLDLDNFKEINDRHGRNVGDRFLKAVSQRLQQTLHADDTLARLGGDEFVAILPELNSIDAGSAALDKLLKATAEPLQMDELTFEVSTSIGVTFYPQVGDVDADQLLRQADQAMYVAKQKGKNRYHIFDPREDRSVRGHHEDIERIRHALAAREFVLFYQPKVNMRTGEILGAEALIRWQHPEAGLLLPVQFLPVIEGQPIAIDLGNWVIDEVLTQMERWRAEGLNLPVCVNITAQQLQQEDFMDSLRAHLAAHPECPASNLELELLESSALQDVPRVSEVIQMCRELGISFALDDFGTGYSTLTYLRNLPAQVLKVDQTFVRGMLEDPEDLTIVEGVLALVGAFRRQAVAEGVESAEHGMILLRLGCEMAQGYHIARPMPADQIAGWAAAWKPDPQWVEAGPVTEADRPVLYAGVEHRAWFARVESILSGSHPMQTVAGEHQCRLGTWLHEQHVSGGRKKTSLARLEALHRKVHALGAELLAQRAAGDRTEAWRRLDLLREQMGPLQDKIQDLIRTIPKAR